MTVIPTEPIIPIGQLAEATGCNVPTIRYYEEIGLLPPAQRRASGHRVYDASDAERLVFIRHCREFGFSIEDIRSLLSLSTSRDRECGETRDIARQHLETVRAKLSDLLALEHSLATFVESCSAQGDGQPASLSTILKEASAPWNDAPQPGDGRG